jgi:hypothetical protein
MALQSSGAISLSEIQTEFGGSNPISISEYYASGAYVASGTTGDNGAIPTSGEISIGDFYGAAAVTRVTITLTTSADTNGYNIFNNRGGTYVAGQSDITLVNNANIYSTSGVALDTGTGWTAGDTITIDNNALIVGHGGDGGNGGNLNSTHASSNGTNGGAGSTAFNLQYNITLDNTGGTISGGSGGGGGGGSGVSGQAVKGGTNYGGCTGSGGGAGRASASGGSKGTGTAQNSTTQGNNGNASSITNLGTGGAGTTNTAWGTATGGAGGNGGANTASAGANGAGGSGTSASSGGTGGAGGKAVNLNGNSITYTATGTIYGAVS